MISGIEFGSIGFYLSALGYLAFWGLLLTVRTKSVQKHLLSILIIFNVLWSLINADPSNIPIISASSFAAETTQKIIMLLFLFAAYGDSTLTIRQFCTNPKVGIAIGTVLIWLAVSLFGNLDVQVRVIGTLLLVIVLLAMIEGIYRKSAQQRWAFKPLIVAFGVCLLIDFYLLAEAALLGSIHHLTWQTRGYVHLALLPFLVIATKRIKSWSINVFVSRDIVLQSSLVMAAGFYLCTLSLAGYYVSYIGGSWTSVMQIMLVTLGISIFSVFFFSEAIRRKSRVFIEKHFFANTFDYRKKWVELTAELKTIEIADQNAPEVCLRAWCKAIGYQDGALIKTQGDFFKLLANTDKFNYGNQISDVLKAYQVNFANKTWLIDFSNTKDKDVSLLLQNIDAEKLGFQLLIPILSKSKHWGFCLLKPKANERLALNWELRDYLIAVTEQISSYLFMSEASKTLSENAQFMAFSRMSAFVVHDLKNVKAQIDMLLKNAQKHRHNPEFIDDAFSTIEAMQSRLGNMLGQLTNKQSNHEQTRRVMVGELLSQIINERCQTLQPSPELQVLQDGQLQVDVERFGNVVFHLIDNAQQATADDGAVKVIVRQSNSNMIIEIADTGCGMTAEFIRDRLFKPFDTTKGNAGMGIGAFDAQTFVQSMLGHLDVKSTVGVGTTFTLQLPINYNQTNTRNVV